MFFIFQIGDPRRMKSIPHTLHILSEPKRALAEIHRVLKADSRLIAPNFIHDNDHIISGMMSKALSAAGAVFEAKWDAPRYTCTGALPLF